VSGGPAARENVGGSPEPWTVSQSRQVLDADGGQPDLLSLPDRQPPDPCVCKTARQHRPHRPHRPHGPAVLAVRARCPTRAASMAVDVDDVDGCAGPLCTRMPRYFSIRRRVHGSRELKDLDSWVASQSRTPDCLEAETAPGRAAVAP
jgi:hypothetical protein